MLVVLAHVPLVLLFLWGWRISRDEPAANLVFVGLWPPMQQPDPVTLPPVPSRSASSRAVRSASPRPVPPAAPLEPSSAITSPSNAASPAPSSPAIDWRAEGAAAAARQAAPPAATAFSDPPKTTHKACEKRKSSWEWNRQPKKAGVAPLPYVVLGRCVVGLGFFGCSPQRPPEANSHLLDDMRDGKASPSSVPDPDTCD